MVAPAFFDTADYHGFHSRPCEMFIDWYVRALLDDAERDAADGRPRVSMGVLRLVMAIMAECASSECEGPNAAWGGSAGCGAAC
ncbi:MAG: hypothetical protein GF331_15775 [Chitinivibrionales bacterium]|nr:hypothetical protein [Chitinivibrionales bacterium]